MASLCFHPVRAAALLVAALAMPCIVGAQQAPSAKNARILLLPRKMVSGDRTTLAVLDFGGRLTPGATGTVAHVDDLGTIHVRWDDGHSLGIVPAAGDRIDPE